MNILVPDTWLREYVKTKATPQQIKEYLSLCGPSVERIHGEGKNIVYDIEVTSNRPDAMSIFGIAREAAAILPRFDIAATLKGSTFKGKVEPSKKLKLTVKTDSKLNPHWTSVVFDKVTIGPSPKWLTQYLELSGIRSINTVIDITNFLMRAYGQPAHVYDYDSIKGHTMTLRASKKGEKLVTLDRKKHTLPGDDIVIADGSGKLIDLCGIMGGKNSSVTEKTTRVVLFLQTYNPSHIRKTSMSLAHRTEAASLFEKGIDPELVMPVFLKGVEMMKELTGGKIASRITDIYPEPYKTQTVSVKRSKFASYVGEIPDKEIKEILTSLGISTTVAKDTISVNVPSFRRDVAIDVDIVEEIARIYGFHNIAARLPMGEPPVVLPDPALTWEEEIKIRLRDWGYTETLTYSMISEAQMEVFGLDKTKAYKITNPLSEEWKYMRPSLLPSMLETMSKNKNIKDNLMLFELSMIYPYRTGDLPSERPTLIVAAAGHKFRELKGLAEVLFQLLGITEPTEGECKEPFAWYTETHLDLGDFGVIGEIRNELLQTTGIRSPVTVLDLDVVKIVEKARPEKKFVPIPKHPPVVEDIAFTVPERFAVGPLIEALKKAHPLVSDVSLLDVHENTRTLHVTYLDRNKNLTNEDIVPIREKLTRLAEEKFSVTLKTP